MVNNLRSFERSELERKRCYLKTVTSSKPLDREYPKWRTGATMYLQFRTNFAGRYIEMRMRRVQLTMRTEGITDTAL